MIFSSLHLKSRFVFVLTIVLIVSGKSSRKPQSCNEEAPGPKFENYVREIFHVTWFSWVDVALKNFSSRIFVEDFDKNRGKTLKVLKSPI